VIGPEGGPYKVGIAGDPQKRCEALQTGNPEKLAVHHICEAENAKEVETAVHGFLRDCRVMGEWFAADVSDIVSAISRAMRGERPAPKPQAETAAQFVTFDLRAWRVAHGLTQGSLARLLKVSPRTIINWEQGATTSPGRVVELACRQLEGEMR